MLDINFQVLLSFYHTLKGGILQKYLSETTAIEW